MPSDYFPVKTPEKMIDISCEVTGEVRGGCKNTGVLTRTRPGVLVVVVVVSDPVCPSQFVSDCVAEHTHTHTVTQSDSQTYLVSPD